jgi:four helix bundle protein
MGMGYFLFEKLDVWKRSVEWADEVFTVADNLPQKYQFSLGEQLRRAGLSVPTNIAEGSGRALGKESAYFYRIARGSLYEVISLLVMCGKRNSLSRDKYQELRSEAGELAAMLTTLAN